MTKHIRSALSGVLVAVLMVGALTAQSNTINYQGELRRNGQLFSGAADFKFAIVESGTPSCPLCTHWSQDGTSAAGSEPAGSLSLPVSNGVFSVRLGDPAIMTPLSLNAFASALDPKLRVWVNTGSGFEQLSDQPIGSSYRSLHAGQIAGLFPGVVPRWDGAALVNSGLTVTPSAQLGIGTANPNAALQVVESRPVPDFLGNRVEGLRIQHPGDTNTYAILGFDNGSNQKNLAQIGSLFTAWGTYLTFGTSNDYNTGITNKAMVIDPLGHVGIGVDPPTYAMLHVESVYSEHGGEPLAVFRQRNPASHGVSFIPAFDGSDALSIKNSAGDTDRHVLFGDGRAHLGIGGGSIGIGTTSATRTLDVRGGGSLAGIATDGDLFLDSGSPRIVHTGAGTLRILSQTDITLNEAGGRVGIGVPAPVATLDVGGSIRAAGIQILGPTQSGFVFTSDAVGVGAWQAPQIILPGQGLVSQGGSISIAPGGVANAMISDGAVSDAKISSVGWNKITGSPTSPYAFTNAANAFTGNGSGLTALNASNITSGLIANARTTGTPQNSPNTLVLRDGSGGINAGPLAMTASGNVGIGTSTPGARLHVVGTTRTSVVEITGGADLAEPFPITGDDDTPGTVVCADPTAEGSVRASAEPYDTKVCGVISGANGISPGMVMSMEGRLEGGMHVALVGRVYVRCEADAEPIRPGDRLTSGIRPGHAMKVTDASRATGAVIGKALGSLERGTGLVLCLVSLQ